MSELTTTHVQLIYDWGQLNISLRLQSVYEPFNLVMSGSVSSSRNRNIVQT